MSVKHFEEWRVYADLEPFDEERADARAGQVVQAILNVNRGKGRPAIPLKDCVLRFDRAEPVPATPEKARAQVRATMHTLMAMQKAQAVAKVKRKRKA
jgi:hypothetical protein